MSSRRTLALVPSVVHSAIGPQLSNSIRHRSVAVSVGHSWDTSPLASTTDANIRQQSDFDNRLNRLLSFVVANGGLLVEWDF